MKYLFLPLGVAFGFILSRAGATTYDFYAKLFLFKDFQLAIVMGVAAFVGAIGIATMKKTNAKNIMEKKDISYKGKPWKTGLISGSLLFGVGWGVAGACPGTALAMLGEGKLGALFTITGLLIGTYLYGVTEKSSKASNSSLQQAQMSTATTISLSQQK